MRFYRDEHVTEEVVREVVDMARWTGSARNRQPWRLVAVFDESTRAALGRLGAYAGHLADAPAVLVLLGPAEQLRDTEFDLGRMAQSLTLAAASLGLGACIVTLFPDENSRRAAVLVDAEKGWIARHAVALGHPAPAPRRGASTIPAGRMPLGELLRIRR